MFLTGLSLKVPNLRFSFWSQGLAGPHPNNVVTFVSHIFAPDRFIASPCAQSLHIQTGVGRRAQPNAVLEKVFTSITKVRSLSFPWQGALMCRSIALTETLTADVFAVTFLLADPTRSSFPWDYYSMLMLWTNRSCRLHLSLVVACTESRLPPSGWPFQAAGLGGAKGPALVPTPQEPG